MTMENEKLFPSVGEAFVILIFTFLLPIVFVFVLQIFGVEPQSKMNLLLAELLTIVPAVIFLYIRKYSLPEVMRLQPVSWRILSVSALIGISLAFIGDEIERIMHAVIPLPEEIESIFSPEMMKAMLTANNSLEWVLLILSTVVFAGLFEEMLFRGLLQNAFEERMDVTRAVLATAIVFSFIHFNPFWVVPIAILGVFLGVLAWKSNSILPSAIVHGVNNGIALIVTNMPEGATKSLEWNGHVHPVLLLASVGGLYLGMKLFYQFIEEETEIPTLLNQP